MAIARMQAARLTGFLHIKLVSAMGLAKHIAIRLWDLAVLRNWARIMLDRCPGQDVYDLFTHPLYSNTQAFLCQEPRPRVSISEAATAPNRYALILY